jgi:hypothetical protein
MTAPLTSAAPEGSAADPDGRITDALAAVSRFDAAFGAKDVDAVMAAMTEDCVFDATAPPDGSLYTGQQQVRAAFAELFAGNGTFSTEERFACADRVVVRWRYTWPGGSAAADADGAGHVRGVDVFRVRDGLVAEKLAYVKG